MKPRKARQDGGHFFYFTVINQQNKDLDKYELPVFHVAETTSRKVYYLFIMQPQGLHKREEVCVCVYYIQRGMWIYPSNMYVLN